MIKPSRYPFVTNVILESEPTVASDVALPPTLKFPLLISTSPSNEPSPSTVKSFCIVTSSGKPIVNVPADSLTVTSSHVPLNLAVACVVMFVELEPSDKTQ